MTDAAREAMEILGRARIHDETGLHARPAVKLTKLAKGYGAAIEIRVGEVGGWVNAKSPNAVMKLKAAHGETLYFRATGDGAEGAVTALVDLVERNFDG